MSPLEIEAYRGVSLKVDGKGLENNPARKIDKTGKESPVKLGDSVTLAKGELLIIPETPERCKVETEDLNLAIFRGEKHNPEASSRVTVVVKTEEYNLSGGIEEPFANIVGSAWDQKLKENPIVIRTNGRELAKVSWRK